MLRSLGSRLSRLPSPPRGAEWPTSGDPVPYNGASHYPAGPRVFFDGNVMAQIGTFRGVPIYADTTLEPNSIVYVPVSGGQLRPYERRRAGELAGTTGSRAPEFPVASPIAPAEELPPSEALRPVGTMGTVVTAPAVVVARPRPTRIESVPRPDANKGIWIEFNGARWYHDGEAVLYSPERFAASGEYHGFPVYVDSDGKADRIYVTAVRGGPLVPYKK